MKSFVRNIFLLILSATVAPSAMNAFTLDSYAPSSVLSTGRWVKISVEESGPHFISTSSLRSWGFSDPSKVRVFGYGGARIPDQLSQSSYVDDLPLVKSELTASGLVFYAQGPGVWTRERNDIFNHSLNPYTTKGYYYLTDSHTEIDNTIPTEGSAPSATPATTFIERLWHEQDLITPAESGHQLVGEDFRYTPTRIFNFQLPGRVEDTEVWMQCEFFAKCTSATVGLTISANGQTLPAGRTDYVRKSSLWGDTCRIRKRFTPKGTSLALGVGVTISAPVTLANLERLTVTYTRSLSLPATGNLVFTSSDRSLKLDGAKADTRVWDVTNPASPIAMPLTDSGWTNDYSGFRTYAAWTSTSSLPSPRLVGAVSNQNIHAEEVPDLVIVSPASYLEQCRRIAAVHSAEPRNLKVLVVTDEQAYNEFGSGSPDINALRRMLKMFYDRGNAGESDRKLQYVLLAGGVHHDHRRLTSGMRGSSAVTLPIWQTDLGLSESKSYCTDDMLGFLEDNSGLRMAYDGLSIAVGRIPARSLDLMKNYVDRFVSYVNNPMEGEWRNRILLFSDEGNNADHLQQSDSIERLMKQTTYGSDYTFHKVYIDAYPLRNGTSEEAKAKIDNLFKDGIVFWSYIGHGALTNLSNDGIFTASYLNSLYLRHPFFFYGATCSFGQVDGNATSGMESLMLTDAGGAIGGFCAVRPVLIVRNGVLSGAVARELATRANDGNVQPIGEVFRRAKNRLSAEKFGDDNIRRFLLFADPALRLATPANSVRILTINGEEVNGDTQPTLAARSRSVVRGQICDPDGQRIDSFNGWLSLTLYDAEKSFTTFGRPSNAGGSGDVGKSVTFDEQGDRLYAGRTQVTNGEFEIIINMPEDIADNFRPATLSMFAADDENGAEASGVCRDLYVYGYDETASADDVPPVIETLYLNHSDFKSGGAVDENPMLIARVSDDVALNMSAAGIGRQMSVRIDKDQNYTDVATFFTPDADGSPAGTILYQLSDLTAGNHTATLTVWDTGGNSTSASIDFFVSPGLAPKIFDVYSDANPATTEANFYVTHDRPDAMLNLKIEVFDFNGAHVWTSESRGRADMYASRPVTWNLTNTSGSRVTRGIYIYRATVSSEGRTSSQTKRIAVAPH